MTTFRDHDLSAATKAEHATLLRAVMQTGGMGPAGVANDLNSTLQILGDPRHATRNVTQAVDTGPIVVEAELRAIVALTRHHWKDLLDVTIEIPAAFPQFWCRWWIARLAAMRMVVFATESRRRASGNVNGKALPVLRITARLEETPFEEARFDIRVRLEQPSVEAVDPAADSMIAMCAAALHGELATIVTAGGWSTSLSYPVRLAPASLETAGKPSAMRLSR